MNKCCQCFGSVPDYNCTCACHKVDDAEYWETAAYVWLFDAPDAAARETAWARFVAAFPEHAGETAEEFWERIIQTEWFEKHQHHYRHHHFEYEDEWSEEYTDASGKHEEMFKSIEEYDENEDDGVYSTRYEQEIVDDTETISDTGEFKREHVYDETDTTNVEDAPFEHKRVHHHHEEDELDVVDEPLQPGDTRPLGEDGPDPVPDPFDPDEDDEDAKKKAKKLKKKKKK